MAVPAWTSTRSPGAPDRRWSCRPRPRPVGGADRRRPSRPERSTTSRQPSLVGAGDAGRARSHASSAGVSRPGCSKHTWVSSHSTWYSRTSRPSCAAAAGDVVDPQHVVGRARRRAAPGADPQRRGAPGAGAPHRGLHDRVVGRADGDQHVAGADGRPQRGDRIGIDDAHRRQRPLAHDHRVDELHRDVAGVLRPGRRQAPHRRAGGEPAGQGEGGAGEVLAQAGVQPGCACDPCVDHGPPRRQREHAPRAARDATDPGCGTVPGAGSGRRMSTTQHQRTGRSVQRAAGHPGSLRRGVERRAPRPDDRQGRITTCNRSAERIVGYLEAEIVGQPISSLFPDHLRAQVAEVYETVLSRRHASTTSRPRSSASWACRSPSRCPSVRCATTRGQHRRGGLDRAGRHRDAAGPGHPGRGRGPAAGRRGPGPRRAGGCGTSGPGPCSGATSCTGSTASTRWTSPARSTPTSSCAHPDDRDRLRQSMEDAVRSGRPFEHEYRVVRPDGSERLDLPAGRADRSARPGSSSGCGASART